ncbi:MAG: hypothetical protein Q9201_004962, partial [Fulgogasparrea decipioides]
MNATEWGQDSVEDFPVGDFAYDCKPDRAGLSLTGNFSEMRDSTIYPTADYGYALVDYTDATMSTAADEWNIGDLRGPTLWYAVLMQVQSKVKATVLNNSIGKIQNGLRNVSVYAHGGLVDSFESSGNVVKGILACTTELSDVNYSLTNGSYTINTWTAMNRTASYAFVLIMRAVAGAGRAQLQQGLQTSIAAANKSEDIASGWASTYDQTILSQGMGILLGRPPLSATQDSRIQVTRIPRAPLVTLIVLDLFYAAIGTYLMVAALIAVRKGRSVRDAQARLSTLAVVAESFESPAWGDDARNVDMLFAERRGESTRRIALVRQAGGGGRRYKQIVAPEGSVRKTLTER